MKQLMVLCVAASLAASALAQQKPKNSDIENIGHRDINRGTINFISPEKEVAIGRQLAAEYDRRVKIGSDADVSEYVNRLGQNLALNSDVAVPVTFKVVEADDVDAQSFPGGFVYVNTGTILRAANEAELAFVLAHQLAHIAARHGTSNVSRAELFNVAAQPVVFQSGLDGFSMTSATVALPREFARTIRTQTMEADYLGLQYLYKAGYDAAAAVSLLQKLQALEGPNARGASTTGPVLRAADRIAALRQVASLILPPRNVNILTTQEFEQIKARLRK